jgi:GTP pyrophosphokinase
VETVQLCPPEILASLARTRAAIVAVSPAAEESSAYGNEAAEVIGALTENAELANALLIRPLIGRDGLSAEQLARIVAPGPTEIALDLLRLGELGLPRDWSPSHGLDARQAETVRKMLLAVVRDPRLVLARLAEQLVRLRHARELSAA